jgi:predicted anti-sigma-YlaC factor YlaD
MISCDECQKRIVAVFDNEGGQGDEKLVSVHVEQCPKCRAFQEDMVTLRQQFVSVPVPTTPPQVGRQLMEIAQADRRQSKNLRDTNSERRQPLLARFPRLAWAGGLAALFLVTISWLACFALAKEAASLRRQLRLAKQDSALVRQEQQRKEAQEREQKAIAALFFRMQELEERVDRFSSPKTTLLPAEQNGLFNGPGQM